MSGPKRMAGCLAVLVIGVRLAGAETVAFTGTVTGPSGALSNATVRVLGGGDTVVASGKTASDGTFSMQAPKGTCSVSVVPPSGSNLAEDFTQSVEFGDAREGRFALRKRVTLAGRCRFPAGTRNPHVRLVGVGHVTRVLPGVDSSGRFEWTVPADVYSVHCRGFVGSEFWSGRHNVDARSGNVTNIDVTAVRGAAMLTKTPPRASLVSISAAGSDGVADVVGAPGAVEPLSAVVIGNLNTQQIEFTVSAADGSFATRMFAPPGSYIQIKHDPTGWYLPAVPFNGTINELGVTPGTIVHVPLPAEAGSFAAGGWMNYWESLEPGYRDLEIRKRFGVRDPGQWWVRGSYGSTVWTPGSSITLRGTITLHARGITASTSLSAIQVTGELELERWFDESGRAVSDVQQFVSSTMTPTGLPIERVGFSGVGAQVSVTSLRYVEPNRVEADWKLTASLPATLRPGLYVPRLQTWFSGVPASPRSFDAFPTVESGPADGAALPPVRVGEPAAPRLYWMLGADELVNGLRGGVALEDRGRFHLATHVAIPSDVQVLPPADPRSGAPITYRLEPFVPMMTSSTARLTDPPPIAFRFPSGSLTVRVTDPDGAVRELGTAPFVQSMSRMPSTRTGDTISGASSTVSDFYQLTTLDPRFDHQFTRYGKHVVTMTGWIEDVRGNRYEGGGSYEVLVARPLDLDTAMLPGTPIVPGSAHLPEAVLHPPVPGLVEMTIVHMPDSDPARAERTTLQAHANRFGVARLSAWPLRLDQPGEYRIDVTARHVDADGTWWAGAATWGSVVPTPSSPLVVRGRRGFDLVDAVQPQWFLVREARAGGDHVMYPFHSGDVMWMQKDDPAADIPKITVQDTQGAFASRVRNRHGYVESPRMEERIAMGEIPLFSSGPNGGELTAAPELVDQRAYFYAYAERPGVRVRELISEDYSPNGYWRFNDNYQFQLGNGQGGDLPNDFKFQFGGAVFRDSSDGFRYYGAYASFFVLLPFADPVGGRVMPPFQGNGGGPDGGPLFTLKGQDIDLFFHPTGVRPGTILHRGQRISFAGYAAPTLPAKLEILVTSPSGVARTIRGQADAVGWFYDPAQDFGAFESGLWKAKVKILFDGRTSAGQVTEPYPTGNVPGSRSGEFYFYVVDADAPQLEVSQPSAPFVRPADGPITFSVVKPAGLTDARLTWTTTMPGFILQEGTKTSMSYTYDAPELAKSFPNLDLHDTEGYAGADTITISLLVSGVLNGEPRHYARQIVIQGEELQMPDQSPRPKRRAVR